MLDKLCHDSYPHLIVFPYALHIILRKCTCRGTWVGFCLLLLNHMLDCFSRSITVSAIVNAMQPHPGVPDSEKPTQQRRLNFNLDKYFGYRLLVVFARYIFQEACTIDQNLVYQP